MEKIIRQIDVFDNKTERLSQEIQIHSFDLELMKFEFKVSNSDPLMYNPYEIRLEESKLFPEIQFNFNKYSYYLACYQNKK